MKYQPGHVLVAEDDHEMRRVLARALAKDHHQVTVVSDGSKLLEEIDRLRREGALPDLIVSDVRMPGISGLSVLAQVKRCGFDIPVMLITAFCDDDTLDHAYRLGAWCVFAKPFDMDDFRTAVLCALAPMRVLRA